MPNSWGRFFLLAFTAGVTFARPYQQIDSYVGQDFLNAFTYEVIGDPTHGRVNYVDARTAVQQNLTYASEDHFIMRADFTKFLPPDGPGRDSVRLKSNKQYTTSVMIFNVFHMPTGCGTWPAIWTLGDDWPNQGEIDILEGVNDMGPNQVTLHTNNGCTMPAFRLQQGVSVSDDCDAVATNNVGCGVKLTDSRSYGSNFNLNGGGYYAIERTGSFIKVWFWSRTGWIPPDVRDGESFVNTDYWGVPAAYFPSDSCFVTEKFGPHNIVIDLTFCGDWAGNVYDQSGCPLTCIDFVNNYPLEFQDAYFDFAWLKIYG